MICRLWHGWTSTENAASYEAYLGDELYPRLERELGDRGYRGHHVVRRERDGEVEFVTMTWFDSLESVRSFAGDDFETPVITGKAAELGILISGGEALEQARRLTTVVLDKTGTITRGRPALTEVHPAAGTDAAHCPSRTTPWRRPAGS